MHVMMKRFISIILFFHVIFTSFALSETDSYETLSGLSTEELISEGREYFKNREAGRSLTCFLLVVDRLENDCSRQEKEIYVRALNNAGCVYKYFYFDYPQAYEYLNRAYEVCRSIGYDSFLPVILVNLGDLFCDYGYAYNSKDMIKEAEDIFNESFNNAFKNKNWELLTTAFFNLSNLTYDIDLSKYSEIFSNEIPSDTPDLKFVRLQYEGIKNLQEGKYQEARICFERQLASVNTRWEARRDTIGTYINIAETYKRERDYPLQIKLLLQALDKADDTGMIDMEVDIARQLADAYRNLDDTVLFQKYHSMYLEKREEMHNAQLASIGELKYISNLRAEQAKVQSAGMRNRFLNFIVIMLVSVLLIILVFIFLMWRNYRAIKARNQSLFDKYQLLLDADTSSRETKYSRSNLDDTKKEELIIRINEVMGDPSQICRNDFSSKELAQLVGSNTSYVSQVINGKMGISFSTLLRNSRIKIACHRISEDPQYSKYGLEAIANSVGFKSRTAFINAFKREVGLTPSEYIKMASAKRKKS